MRGLSIVLFLCCALILSACTCSSAPCARSDGAQRVVEFTATTTVPDIPAGTRELRVWIPAPQEGVDQCVLAHELQVTADTEDASPASGPQGGDLTVSKVQHTAGPNRWWHVSVLNPPAKVTITQIVTVHRNEVRHATAALMTRGLNADERVAFAPELSAHSLVPVSGPKLDPLVAEVAPGLADPIGIARATYRFLLERMRYSKEGEGWGRGDSNWACDSRYGNCTDFHSLFLSIMRAKGVPARFIMGFPIPRERGTGAVAGYHCWAEFYAPEAGWIPVDISEADKHPELADYYFGNLTEDRIAFVQGRDIMLNPAPRSGPQNIFIYALAEADGAPVKTVRAMQYADQ